MARDPRKPQQNEYFGAAQREVPAPAAPAALPDRGERTLTPATADQTSRPAEQRSGEAPAGITPRNLADDLLQSIRSHWQIVALVALAVTLLTWIVVATQPKRYRAVSIVAVTPLLHQMSTADILRGIDSLDRRMVISTVAALASTSTTLAQAGAHPDDHVEAAVLPMTNLFSVTVEGGDARRVAAIANTIPRSLNDQARTMFLVYGVSLASPAATPQRAALPRIERALLAGLILGLLAGIAAAYAIDRRRAAVR